MPEVRFIADVMVGRLARWLRVLGFDVAYSNQYKDDEILRIAREENRIILTRDTGIKESAGSQSIFIESGDCEQQMRQVLTALGLRQFQVLSRCLVCNVKLRETDKETVFERIPHYVYLTHDRFAVCPECNRVYWHGTHVDKMLERLHGLRTARLG
jgi:uncharacterized protein with PIN domain